MKNFEFLKSPPVFIEIGTDSLALFDGARGLELPLDRAEGGALTAPCRDRVAAALRGFLGGGSAWTRRRAWCALAARGVSLRRLTLPPAPESDCERLLALQIESSFPLSPEELAWGARPLNGTVPASQPQGRDWLVAAIRKDALADYTALLSECGLEPIFTVAALLRSGGTAHTIAPAAGLHLGARECELTLFDHSVPSAIRVIPWDSSKILTSQPSGDGAELQSLAAQLRPLLNGGSLHLTGSRAALETAAPALAAVLGNVTRDPSPATDGNGQSAAILGMHRVIERGEEAALLTLRLHGGRPAKTAIRPATLPWAALFCVLLAGALSFRYVESAIWRPKLAKRLAELKSRQNGLPKIDRELEFLQHLDRSRPPFLDALASIANAAAPGTRVETFSINQRGDVALKLSMQNPQQAVDFRSKLIEAGFFSVVVVEEQAPVPNRPQQVNVRITAQCKPPGSRPVVKVPPSSGNPNPAGMPFSGGGPAMPMMPPMGMGMPMPGAMPGGMPPGFQPNMPPGGSSVILPPNLPPGVRIVQ